AGPGPPSRVDSGILPQLPQARIPGADRVAAGCGGSAGNRRTVGIHVRAQAHRLRRAWETSQSARRLPGGRVVATLTITSGRDIPAQVVGKRGGETAKVQLSARFQEAVDRAAMRAGKGSSDAYLADWKRSEPQPCDEDIHNVVASVAADI